MASTNKTTHYELSQYVGSDKPTYLGDYNTDMSKIDSAINTAKTTADTASTAATSAQTAAEGAQTSANTAITNAAAAQTSANSALNDIGTMANLTTAEKNTLVGAINEVDGDVGNLSSLSTTAKTSVVAAINEVEEKIDELDNYSVDEALTGQKWVNNKPIYRKVFTVNNATPGQTTTINISNINIDEVVLYNAVISQGGVPQFEGPFYNSASDRFRVLVNTSLHEIDVIVGANNSSTNMVRIILEYTKTI